MVVGDVIMGQPRRWQTQNAHASHIAWYSNRS